MTGQRSECHFEMALISQKAVSLKQWRVNTDKIYGICSIADLTNFKEVTRKVFDVQLCMVLIKFCFSSVASIHLCLMKVAEKHVFSWSQTRSWCVHRHQGGSIIRVKAWWMVETHSCYARHPHVGMTWNNSKVISTIEHQISLCHYGSHKWISWNYSHQGYNANIHPHSPL